MTKSKMVGGMGFRDLALYNDSLLAKQAWHLLHNKSSLFYKVFKARFFPNCSIMEAHDSRSASYAWRSILRGREVLQRGARWRVGNGDSIKIWQHSWLPRKHTPQLMSYPISSMENAKVAVLIDESTRQWNEERIDGIFASDEAAIIKKISLGRLATEDVLIWPYSNDGRYTCKSGYRFLKEEVELSSNQQHSTPDTHLWKQLWSLQVPNKVRNLLWRTCRNAMPTVKNTLSKQELSFH